MVIAPELAKKVQGIVKVEGELGLHDAVAFMLPRYKFGRDLDGRGSSVTVDGRNPASPGMYKTL